MPEDVPDKVDGENIVESVIFALKTFNKVVEDETDETLHIMAHLLEGQYGEKVKRAKAVMFLNARYKAGYLLMRPDINRPKEAAYYLKASMDAQRAEFPHKFDHWLMNPHVWASYGEALCLSEDYREAKVALERALTGCEVGSQPALAGCILRCHINLSLTLKALKVEATAQKEHRDWAATHLRKTPTRLITKAALNQIMHPPGGRVHPVLEALGGESWFDKLDSRDVLSLKEEERSIKLCRQCGIRDIQKSLFRCSRCQYMYYCSKACQKANWKAHKEGCTDRYNAIKKLEKLKKEDPSAAQRHAD
ncbi:hypothetical protein PENSPDRAFT_249870 [Peniophora sp. CONT]|nr:hypothetical protein PENSPDRAFT_249870 [Peniophora sp. CONT]